MTTTTLFVGNLPYTIAELDLEEVFSAFGTVEQVRVPLDKITARPMGYGFVDMATKEEAEAAIAELDQTKIGGRSISVRLAEKGRSKR